MDGPMREVTFTQTHRRTQRRRNIIVSQFDDTKSVIPIRPNETKAHVLPNVALAWRYIVQTDDGPWTTHRRVDVALDASDSEVVMAVARHLASPGWNRDAAVARIL
jgi:hypothetical protein